MSSLRENRAVTVTLDKELTIKDVAGSFEDFIKEADEGVENFIKDNTNTEGQLEMSASQSLQLQQLMADQSIAAQTGTSTLKGVKDSITAAARNI
ncbi:MULTISPECIES: hypothetical protein [Vibrio harveyi group]|uniref:Uncharacterized protein n=1 Tax=Vibrio harveyi TaxID=669 RepID=A0ABN4KTC7_VIBHA|nr:MULTISPECIES: hypothetical protein [Vibrio harveyi group]AMF96296.1 hypothetical protein AL538_00440 [Vibrio harveyi]EKO3870275.1 hypothetical protein [Vibrio harveyi]ELC3158214.1 hypothetical protein [Vibrio harveyi]MDF5599666.1 hypothetical protein [Vibrio parahaemolyticus]MEA5385435.1 hypothetical protein [Vibrio parahaemolyticus]